MSDAKNARYSAASSPIERTTRSLEELHARHYQDMSLPARVTHRTTSLLAEPLMIALIAAFLAAWILWNTVGARWGLRTFDPYPFQLLEFVGTTFAAITTLLILATQRREDRLDEQRAQFTLQMATLSEQKTAKIIALLEELRRDSPQLQSRSDAEAEEMASPADPHAVLERIAKAKKNGEP